MRAPATTDRPRLFRPVSIFLSLAVCLGLWGFAVPVSTRADDDAPATARAQAKAKAKAKAQAKAKVKARAKAKPKAQTPTKPAANDRDEARAIARDFAELAAAVRGDAQGIADDEGADWLAKLGRPEKRAQAPTLTSADLDALIDSTLEAEAVEPAPRSSDEAFLRRVALDLSGKLPTPDRLAAFVADPDPSKRSEAIDELLASPEFAAHWAKYWRDAFSYRATFMNPRLVDFDAFETWMAEQFAANRPWDEIARAIIAASGKTVENPAGVFTAAHQARPVDVAGEVSRVFLGVQIQCAECHDHPSDPWKREQFHEFAAFFAGTTSRRDGKVGDVYGTLIGTRDGTVRYAMPDLQDPKKQIPVEPKFFLASDLEVPKTLTAQRRRELAASLVASQDNPWFARAFVNRAWASMMGEGFYDPVDDLGPARDPQAPEVIEALADAFSESGYDVRWLFGAIANTEAYQRQFRSSRSEAGQTAFAANCPSRLRADQILEALSQAIGLDLAGPGAPGRGGRMAENPKAVEAAKRRAQRAKFAFEGLFGVDPSTPEGDVLGTIPQSLFLMNSQQVNAALKSPRGPVADVLKAHPKNDRAAVEALYLQALARRPNPEELAVVERFLADVPNRREAFEDLLWTLVNSAEFVSRR